MMVFDPDTLFVLLADVIVHWRIGLDVLGVISDGAGAGAGGHQLRLR